MDFTLPHCSRASAPLNGPICGPPSSHFEVCSCPVFPSDEPPFQRYSCFPHPYFVPNRAPCHAGPPGAADNAPNDDFTDLPALVDIDDDNDDDAELCDDDLEHLPYEERVQLALTAIRASVMSDRGACKYYRVTRGNYSHLWKTLQP